MENYAELIMRCKENEKQSAIKGIAMGAVILSRMGPIYEKKAITKFQNLAVDFSEQLKDVTTIDDFDSLHRRFIQAVLESIKSSKGEILTTGQAQKSVNVFLKNYVDRSNLPDPETAQRIKPFLHVPLDSVMIKYFRKNHRSGYDSYIAPVHTMINNDLRQRNQATHITLPDNLLSQLQYILEDEYLAWQRWFRSIFPTKPVLLDTIWAIEREQD